MERLKELKEVWAQMRKMVLERQEDKSLQECKKRFVSLVNSLVDSSEILICYPNYQIRLPKIVTAVFDYSQETPALQLWYTSNGQVCSFNLYFRLSFDFVLDGGG